MLYLSIAIMAGKRNVEVADNKVATEQYVRSARKPNIIPEHLIATKPVFPYSKDIAYCVFDWERNIYLEEKIADWFKVIFQVERFEDTLL